VAAGVEAAVICRVPARKRRCIAAGAHRASRIAHRASRIAEDLV
jgi:hypothetical protein